jgi:transcriptional regulator with XRE-family HTH domain
MNEVEAVPEDIATDPIHEMLEESEATAYAYLLESWLTSTVAALRDARRREGLTQEDIAEQLNTKQPAIARLERDHEGRFSLRRFAEYSLACGMLPLDVSLRPAHEIREYALSNPDAPKTDQAFEAWSSKALASGNMASPQHYTLSIGSQNRANLDVFFPYSEADKTRCLVSRSGVLESWARLLHDESQPLKTTIQDRPRTTFDEKPESGLGTSQKSPSIQLVA